MTTDPCRLPGPAWIVQRLLPQVSPCHPRSRPITAQYDTHFVRHMAYCVLLLPSAVRGGSTQSPSSSFTPRQRSAPAMRRPRCRCSARPAREPDWARDATAASGNSGRKGRCETRPHVGFHLHDLLLTVSESVPIARELANSCWPHWLRTCAPSRGPPAMAGRLGTRREAPSAPLSSFTPRQRSAPATLRPRCRCSARLRQGV